MNTPLNDGHATRTAAGAPPLPNLLHELHTQADAEFQPYGAVEIVSTFGEPQAEYAAIRKGCALIDLPQRGLLEVSGKDRLPFLNNLLTNETWSKVTKSGLAAGKGVYAFFLNNKGRIVADMNVLERGEIMLLEMDARMVAPIRAAFERYIFTEKVQLHDRLGALHEFALHGPGAPAVIDAAAGGHVVELPPLGSTQATLFGVETTLWRDDVCDVPGLHLIVDAAHARTVWMNLIAQLGQSAELGRLALRPAGWAAFNACRIEGGRPFFGIDFDDTILPAETGQLARAVSFTKGCYLGQEIVARMHARSQVAKQIVALRLEDDALPLAGTALYDEQQNQVGGVTSSTISPVLSNAAICLGFLKKPFYALGTVVSVPAEGSFRKATVVQAPFLPAP